MARRFGFLAMVGFSQLKIFHQNARQRRKHLGHCLQRYFFGIGFAVGVQRPPHFGFPLAAVPQTRPSKRLGKGFTQSYRPRSLTMPMASPLEIDPLAPDAAQPIRAESIRRAQAKGRTQPNSGTLRRQSISDPGKILRESRSEPPPKRWKASRNRLKYMGETKNPNAADIGILGILADRGGFEPPTP